MLKAERVNHTSYLLNEVIDLSELENDILEIADLKAGYTILQTHVEIVEAGTGTADLGNADTKDFFVNDIDLAAAEGTCYTSKRRTTLKDDIVLTLDTASRDGVIAVRVFYFTESKMFK